MKENDKRFFTRHPYIFALLAILIFGIASFLGSIVQILCGFGGLLSGESYFAVDVSKIFSEGICIVVLLLIVWKLGFLSKGFFLTIKILSLEHY